ncbi:MAG: polymerase, sigma-E factor [Bacteroidota bacterium]
MYKASLLDRRIIDRIREGDREVLIELYKAHEGMIANHVFQHSGNDDDVKDLMQDTLVAIWQNVRKPQFELSAKLSTYLFAIAKNLWLPAKRWQIPLIPRKTWITRWFKKPSICCKTNAETS